MRHFKNILCAIEGGDSNKLAVKRAVELAENNQANLTVIDVIPRLTAGVGLPDGGPISRDLQSALVTEHEARIRALIEPYRKRIDIQHKVISGTSFLEIIREVLRHNHDLVIKCPESPDWLDRLFAGDDMHLLRKCPCPVWLIKPHSSRFYQCVLAAVDVDDSCPPTQRPVRQELNRKILEMAASLAASESSALHIVHVWDALGESSLRHGAFVKIPDKEVNAYFEQVRMHHSRLLNNLLKELEKTLGADAVAYLNPRLNLLNGTPRQEIPALAERLQVDCVVMGTVARTGIRGFIMGNTAETILEQINCSVLAIKPPGFETPVEQVE